MAIFTGKRSISEQVRGADAAARRAATRHDPRLPNRLWQDNDMHVLEGAPWGTDWAWSLPLILLNVIIHVFGLAFIYDGFTALFREIDRRRKFMFRFAVTMSAAVFLIVALHGIEAITWALAYLLLGAISNFKFAMLYSLGAMTGFGAGNVSLPPHWQMMGVLQSLAGVLLFGFTTAFMFAMFQTVWPSQQPASNRQVFIE